MKLSDRVVLVTGAGLVLARCLFVMCAIVAFTSAARAQEFPSIVVTGPPVDDFKPVYWGIQSGLFRKYGLNVTVSPVNSGSAAMAAVAGGAAQVAFTNLTQVIQSHVHAAPFKIVAPAQWYTTDHPDSLLLAKKDSPIRSGRDMNGKTLAVTNLNGLAWLANLNWVDRTGGDSKTVRVLELPNSAMQEALIAGRIDAATFISPFMERALATGQIRVLAKSYDWIAKRFEASAYVSTAEYIAANQDTMKRFSRAMHDAIVYTNSHLSETTNLVASFSGVDPAVIAQSVRPTDPEYVDAKNIQPLIDVGFRLKATDRTFNADELIADTVLRPTR